MSISEFHASHIGRVKVAFSISGPNINPQKVTEALGIQPDSSVSCGDDHRNFKGELIEIHSEDFWQIDTKDKVNSKDINDHFHYLLSKLLSHTEAILKFAQDGETYFDILWESSYLYAGTGPVISRENLQGISQLQAGMGFDIYQIEQSKLSA